MERDAIPMKIGRVLKVGGVLIAVAALAVVGTYAVWSLRAPERTCASCHEIQSAHEMWADSPHRDVGCAACHGTAVSSGLHSMTEKVIPSVCAQSGSAV